MIDYKRKTSYTLRAVPKKPFGRKTSTKKEFKFSYRFKFYLTIFLILLGCYAYIHYQVVYDEGSVFYELSNIFYKYIDLKPNIGKKLKHAKNNLLDSEKKYLEKESIDRNWSIDIYLMKTSKNSAVLLPMKAKMHGGREDYFKNLITTLINFKSENRKIINGFQNKVKLKNAYLENDVLILDFNESFEFSRYGYAGLNLRIQQILWTVFNSKGAKAEKIANVSLMINGKRKRKIGGEGLELKLFYSKKDIIKTISLKGNS